MKSFVAALAGLAGLTIAQAVQADTGPRAEEGENLTFEFKLTTPPPEGSYLTYSFRSEDGTADDRTDYYPVDGALGFFPGDTTVRIVVRTIRDMENEEDETMRVLLYDGKLEGVASLTDFGSFKFPKSMTLTGTILNVEITQDDSGTPDGLGLSDAPPP